MYEHTTPFKNLNLIVISFIILLSGILVGIRTYYTEPRCDDLIYKFCLGNINMSHEQNLTKPISNLTDAIISQYHQYFVTNGRTLIHIIVQMFAGPWGTKSFAIFNGLQFILTIILFGILTIPSNQRNNVLNWVLITIGFLYLYQDNGSDWYTIAYSLNYLTPILLVCSFLLCLKYYKKKQKLSNIVTFIPVIVLSIISGWSHESYSLTLSGALLFWLIQNYNRISKYTVILIISFWVGTAILFFAPGNFTRISKEYWWTLKHGIKYLANTYFLWALLFISIIFCLKNGLKSYVISLRRESIYLYALIFASLFGLIANTSARSFNGVSLYCALLCYSLLFNINKSKLNYYKDWSISIALILCVSVSIHQYRIVNTCQELQHINHQFVINYINSSDGRMTIPDRNIPSDVKPFIVDWYTKDYRWVIYDTLNKVYCSGDKPISFD